MRDGIRGAEYRIWDMGFIKRDHSPYSNVGTPSAISSPMREVPLGGVIFLLPTASYSRHFYSYKPWYLEVPTPLQPTR